MKQKPELLIDCFTAPAWWGAHIRRVPILGTLTLSTHLLVMHFDNFLLNENDDDYDDCKTKPYKNGGFPLTLTVALTTGQHYRAACDDMKQLLAATTKPFVNHWDIYAAKPAMLRCRR